MDNLLANYAAFGGLLDSPGGAIDYGFMSDYLTAKNRAVEAKNKDAVSKSNLADANEKIDWRIYADFAQILIKKARSLYFRDNDFRLDIDNMVYAFDSSTINLCLSLFPWAKFHHQKGAVKMHTLLDLRGSIPVFIHLTDGSVHDVNALDSLLIEPAAFYLMDKGYVDFY